MKQCAAWMISRNICYFTLKKRMNFIDNIMNLVKDDKDFQDIKITIGKKEKIILE